VRLIAELDEKDKSVIFGLIETILTKKKVQGLLPKKRSCSIKQKSGLAGLTLC
jgi:hypothetical protein